MMKNKIELRKWAYLVFLSFIIFSLFQNAYAQENKDRPCNGKKFNMQQKQTITFFENKYVDFCSAYLYNGVYVDMSAQVVKFYCVNATTMGTAIFSCGSGKNCYDGSCIKTKNLPFITNENILPKQDCTESDLGVDPQVRGRTILHNKNQYVDFCVQGPFLDVSIAESNFVHEYYCDKSGKSGSITLLCPTGQMCKNGACINKK